MPGKIAIFRMTDTTDREATITADKIEMVGGVTPDNRTEVISFTPVMTRTPAEVPAPFLDEARKPDTGFAGNRYTLQLFFDESLGTAASIEKLRDWFINSNSIKAKFKNGRFGIRNDYRPEFDLVPNNDAGYKLVHFEIMQDLAIPTLFRGTVILEFSGDPARLGVVPP